jgi:hypothetical protein
MALDLQRQWCSSGVVQPTLPFGRAAAATGIIGNFMGASYLPSLGLTGTVFRLPPANGRCLSATSSVSKQELVVMCAVACTCVHDCASHAVAPWLCCSHLTVNGLVVLAAFLHLPHASGAVMWGYTHTGHASRKCITPV